MRSNVSIHEDNGEGSHFVALILFWLQVVFSITLSLLISFMALFFDMTVTGQLSNNLTLQVFPTPLYFN